MCFHKRVSREKLSRDEPSDAARESGLTALIGVGTGAWLASWCNFQTCDVLVDSIMPVIIVNANMHSAANNSCLMKPIL